MALGDGAIHTAGRQTAIGPTGVASPTAAATADEQYGAAIEHEAAAAAAAVGAASAGATDIQGQVLPARQRVDAGGNHAKAAAVGATGAAMRAVGFDQVVALTRIPCRSVPHPFR